MKGEGGANRARSEKNSKSMRNTIHSLYELNSRGRHTKRKNKMKQIETNQSRINNNSNGEKGAIIYSSSSFLFFCFVFIRPIY